MANWVIEMNKLEKEILSIMYARSMHIYEVFDEKLMRLFNREVGNIYTTKGELDNSTLPEDLDELECYVNDEIRDLDRLILAVFTDRSSTILRECMPSRKQAVLVKKRMSILVAKINNYLHNFHDMTFEDATIMLCNLLDNINDFLDWYESENLEKAEEALVEFSVEKSGFKFRKLFNYKDMIDYAEDNGFVYKGSNGDHQLYEHKETNKVVVIPAHTLGTGIAYKIQKQIECGCATAVS